MRKEDLRLAAGMTTNMIANMSKEGKHISMDTLARICETLNWGASDKKAPQPTQTVHRQNVEKVVSQETRQNYKAERTTKTQTFEQSKRTTEHTKKNRNLVTKKGQKKK